MRANIVRKAPSSRSLALLLGLAQISGCSHPSPPAIPALPPLPRDGAAAPPRIDGSIGSPNALPPAQIAYGGANGAGSAAGGPGTASAPGPGDVSLDFADTDIREVVAQILGTILKANYTIDPTVHGTATLHTVRPLNRSQLVPTLESLLAQNGAALVANGGIYRVEPIAKAVATAASEGGTAGAIMVPLQFASAEELAKVLQPYVGEGGKIAADPGRNDRARETVAILRRRIRDHRHRPQQPQCLQRQQLRVARPDTEPVEPAAFYRHQSGSKR